MIGLGFPDTAVKWIMTCINTVSYSFIINGSSYDFIKGKRGLQQGDPMSPLLFVLAMKYLSRSLQGLENNPDFTFHPKCKRMKLNHLCFADDLMIVCSADVSSTMLVKLKIEKFGNSSGLMINPGKSHIFIAGVEERVKPEILSLTQFCEGKLPVRYLGIPLISTRLRDSDCKPVVDSIKKKLTRWSSKVLSYAG